MAKKARQTDARRRPATSPGRQAALEILVRVDEGAFADELLHSQRLEELSAADRGLAMEIVMGVLRWRSRLDSTIALHSFTPFRKLDREVLAALRMGAYQLLFLDRIPAHAAVDQSVELVRHSGKASAAALANAVLRKIARTPRRTGDELSSIDPRTASPALLAKTSAHPEWLVARWASEYGPEVAAKIAAHDQRIPPTSLRIAGDARAIEQELAADGVKVAAGELLASALRVISGDLTRSVAFREGRVGIQDEASQLVARLVGRGQRLLDCCAAPGGKTSILAERNPEANIVAAELHPHRAALLRRLVRAANVQIITADAVNLPVRGDFDRVLADVPCSGTGTLARNPEIKWRLKPEDLPDLHGRQVAIIRGALSHLARGGRLVYSTCSLEREENQKVIEEVLAGGGDLRLVDAREELEFLLASGELMWKDVAALCTGFFLRTIPGVHPCDGFFAAILEKH